MIESSRVNFCLIVIAVLMGNLKCNSQSRDYESQLKKIPSFLIDHFPDKLQDDERSRFTTNTDTTSKCIDYILVEYGENAVQRFQKNNLRYEEIGRFNAGDTNIITIIRETVTYWNPEKKRYYTDSMQNKKRYLPIPFFERESESFSKEPQAIYSDKTYSGLSDDFIIYVYEFKPGKYWEGLKTVDYMPKGWENGFSKGVAFSKSKNVVIYWFVVW